MPIRIQRKRTAECAHCGTAPVVADEKQAVESFRNSVEWQIKQDPEYLSELRGHDLVCWCPPGQACHATALLELANQGGEQL